jgi:2-Cys peroxiredoxin 5
MFATARPLPLALARPAAARRLFHASAPALVQVGDKLPNVDLMENSPGNKVNLAAELKSGKGVIIGENNPALEGRRHCRHREPPS